VLFSHLQEDEYNKWKIQAALAGVDVEKEEGKKREENSFTFRDPDEYNHLTEEEKKRLTEKMMGKHREWASKAVKEKKGA